MLRTHRQAAPLAGAAQAQLNQLHDADHFVRLDRYRRTALDGFDHLQIEGAVIAGQIGDALFPRPLSGDSGQQARARIAAKLRIQRRGAALELLLLHIQSLLAIAAQAAVDGEARTRRGDLGAGVQDDATGTVLQHGVEEVIGFGAGSLLGQIQPQGFRLTEQLQRLIQQVCAQIVPEAAARHGLFTPAVANLGTETIEVRLQMIDLTQLTTVQQLLQSQEVGIPTAVVKDRQLQIVLLGQADQAAGLAAIQGEWFVDDHMFAGQQGGLGQGIVSVVGAGDHHQIDARIRQQLVALGDHLHLRPVCLHLGRIAGDYGAQLNAGRAGEQLGVQRLACIAVTDQSCVDIFEHHFLHGDWDWAGCRSGWARQG